MLADMENVVAFTVPGTPVGKGRPRFVRATGRTYTPEKTANFETLVKYEFQKAYPDFVPYEKGVPLEIKIEAAFAPPSSASKKKRVAMLQNIIRPTKIPDVDNVAKAILDALHGVCYLNDSSIVALCVSKHYSVRPCVYVEVREIDGAKLP